MTSSRLFAFATLTSLAVFLGPACVGEGDSGSADPAGKKSAEAPPAKKPAPKEEFLPGKNFTKKDLRRANQQFKTLCVTCHGMSGKGDGAAGKALNPKPRDWTDPAWQDSVDDARLYKVINEGGAAVGLSPLMAPNILYKDNEGVINALVSIVRDFKGK